ncbi:uncharacterized protein SPSK_11028 [Sporothrix schenckii 1099-18]|uniref:Uncharacterized protein n=1 Tax=Sporothrix schenckii 1099-18 TaxID=1397361 RepID=A0A0F2MD32_SPOSC|nr:uncharacterized protein SPSK_11028 [Sporothrix schenckii 1099-18]KJR86974.1 hypothetical protein SPSK_11028 [Sporothrix schenckii 1099-18]
MGEELRTEFAPVYYADRASTTALGTKTLGNSASSASAHKKGVQDDDFDAWELYGV